MTSSSLLLQGIETLSLRMERHCENAMKVAEFLSTHEQVEWVQYGGLASDANNELAQKYMKGTPSSIMTFGIKGGLDAGTRFYDALALFKRLVNIGDAKSLSCHPASTTHRQMTEEEQKAAGVTPEMMAGSLDLPTTQILGVEKMGRFVSRNCLWKLPVIQMETETCA